MAKPTTASAAKLTVWVGNGATPTEVFAMPCGLTTKGINFTGTANETQVPDCTDPDAPAWIERVIQSLSAGITGTGVLALEALDTWETFFFEAVAKNCQVIIDWADAPSPPTPPTRIYQGPFLLTTFNITGQLGNKIQVEVALQNDGEVSSNKPASP